MKLWAIIKVAFRALGRNKLRSLLTMLGIIIGVGAVIAMVSIGQGAQSQVQEQIAAAGTNLIFVWPGSTQTSGVRAGAGSLSTLTVADTEAIEGECPAVKYVSPTVNAGGQLIFGNQNWFTRFQGTNEKFPQIRSWKIEAGEFFNEADVRTGARVVVLGKTVADNLFQGIDPVGQSLRIRNLPFRVVGVLAPRGQSLMGQDQDDTVIVPYTTAAKKFTTWLGNNVNSIMMSAVNPNLTAAAEFQVTELLRQRHKIPPGSPEDFQVRNLSDMAETANETNRILTILLGSIAGVSLIVGGIGIMNIMLVSVTERTREIGIRLAIGARGGDVRLQFLTESVVLSLMGGIVGILVGIGSSFAISYFAQWPTLVSQLSIIGSVIFSGAVGIGFGYYPAHKAASLDPIEALRYE